MALQFLLICIAAYLTLGIGAGALPRAGGALVYAGSLAIAAAALSVSWTISLMIDWLLGLYEARGLYR